MSDDTPREPAPSTQPAAGFPAAGQETAGFPAAGHNPSREFPAVSPPSSSFFVQLFLLPALIVFGIMVVWFLFGKIAGTHQSPEEYLSIIKSDRKDRWKAAMDLSYLLQEGSAYTKNQPLAIEVATALDEALATPDTSDPKYIEYLTGAVSTFELDTGVPVLRKAARPEQKPQIRRIALIGLANLSHRIGNLNDPNVVVEVREYLKDDDVEIRELAALTLGQIGSDQAIPALTTALDDPTATVRYNAAIALAILGSDAAMGTYAEMLNPEELSKRFRIADDQGQEHIDAQLVTATILSTLQSLQKLYPLAPATSFAPVLPAVGKLLDDNSATVRQNARELLITIGQEPAGQQK